MMKTKRAKDMLPIEKAIILMIWEDIQNLPNDGRWRKYTRGFTFEGKRYTVICRVFYDAVNFIYKDMVIVADTQTIMLDPMNLIN